MPDIQNLSERDSTTRPQRFWETARLWGLHAGGAVAVLVLVVGVACFTANENTTTMFQVAGLVLFLPVYLLQLYRFDDSRSLALAKALGVSLSISSGSYGPWLIAIGGVLGALVQRRRRALTSA